MVSKTKGKRSKRSSSKRSSKRSKGGKALDAGSYGCVFSPAIKCVDESANHPDTITKLMYKEDTEAELIEMAKVQKYIETIPNKENYFLIADTYQCEPDKLNEEDLTDFDKKCRLFTKRGINRSNVNEAIERDELALIVMPNGGLNVEKFYEKLLVLSEREMYRKFMIANTALIKLLVNGIVPLNLKNFNHYDIKAGNILISDDGHARLIDWGLAGENDGIHIPETIQNRSIAFNMPFSDIFFNSFVKKWLVEELNLIKAAPHFHNKTVGQAELLKIVAVNMINKSIEKTSEGHYEYITNTILHDIYKIYAIKNEYNRIDYNVLSNNALIDYIQAVLLTYVDDSGKFNDTKYFYDVFSKNVDIWGFLLAYVPIIEYGMGKVHIDIINAVCRILLKYCFSTEFATKPINVNELMLELQSLNAIANDIQKKSTRKVSTLLK
jgi:serine/threonine protein kinase